MNRESIGESFADFLAMSLQIYWLLVGLCNLRSAMNFQGRLDTKKLGHGRLEYKFTGEFQELDAFLVGSVNPRL